MWNRTAVTYFQTITHRKKKIAFAQSARSQVTAALAVIKVEGDGDCLFHALASCTRSDGGALRIDVADFLEEQA